MAIYWSASAPAFYLTDYFPEENIPADKVEMSEPEYKSLLDSQSAGMEIVTNPETGGAMAIKRPPPPPLTTPEEAAAMLSRPVTVICESKPDLTANYANNAQVRANIVGVVSQINAGLGLPGGGATFNWPDADGGARAWPASEFVAFANALTNFAYHCGQVAGGFSDDLPSATLTISGSAVRIA